MPKPATPSAIHDELIRLGIKPNDKDFLTVSELAEAWGMGAAAVRSRLHMAMKAGILERGKKQIETLAGHMQTHVGYRINLKGKR